MTISMLKKKTHESEIPFYVPSHFDLRYGRDPRSLRQVEDIVEQQTLKDLEDRCKAERAEQKRALNEARKMKGPNQAEAIHAAHHMEFPSCIRREKLKRYVHV